MEKILNIKNEQLKLKVIDKKLRKTLVCIHGFSSSGDFIGQLDNHINNFNIVSISYQDISKLTIAFVSKIINSFFKHYFKKTQVYVLGHSLGGFFASQVATSKKIKGVYMLNPVHPLLWESKAFSRLKKVMEAKSKITKTTISIIVKMLKIRNQRLVKFIDPESSWFTITMDLVTKEEALKNELIKNYQLIKDKTTFLVCKTDNIISSEKLLFYLKSNHFHYREINYDGHSPLLTNSAIVAPYFLNVKRKRRWRFWTKIV